LQQGAFGASPELQSLLRCSKSNLRATSGAPEKLGACWSSSRLRSSLELGALELSRSSGARNLLAEQQAPELAGRVTSSGALSELEARSLLAEQQAPELSGAQSLLPEQQAQELSGALRSSPKLGAQSLLAEQQAPELSGTQSLLPEQ